MADVNEKTGLDGIVEKVTSNETVQKVMGNKNFKWVKIVAIVLVAVLVFLLIGAIFSDKNAKAAEKYIKREFVSMYEKAGFESVKVKTKTVGKNKDSHLYLVDTTIKSKDKDGDKETNTLFVLVYSDGEDTEVLRMFEYEKSNKKDIKDVAIASLAKG